MKTDVEEIPCFRTPLQLNDKSHPLEGKILEELDIDGRKGGASLYDELLNRDNPITRTPYMIGYPTEITDDKEFLRDTQAILRSPLPEQEELPEVTVRTVELLKRKAFNFGNCGFVEMQCLQWVNKQPGITRFIFAHRLMAPAMGLTIPIALLIAPFIAMRIRNQDCSVAEYIEVLTATLHKHGLGKMLGLTSPCAKDRLYALIAIAMYAFQTWQNVVGCRNAYRCIHESHALVCHVRQYLSTARSCLVALNDRCRPYTSYSRFVERNERVVAEIDNFAKASDTVHGETRIFSKCKAMGDVISCCWKLKQCDSTRRTIRYASDVLDYYSQTRSIGAGLQLKQVRPCRFTTKSTKFRGVTLGSVEAGERVGNDICIVSPILVTGENASGKTTLLKAVATNVILCQQFGIGFFRKARINPYGKIHCYISIPDTSDRDSLFQAEARRCKNILESVTQHPNVRQLCVFDELYSGTNPREATAACIAYIESLARFRNSSVFITTHLRGVCDGIEEGDVQKLQMAMADDGTPLYVAQPGVSRGDSAIKTLRAMSYPEGTLMRAEEVLQTMAW